MLKKISSHALALGGLLLLHISVFARLIFLNQEGVPYATIPFDFASQYSRWLTFISDSLRAGIVPLWVPYVGAGFPFFINPQSQLYSPLTLLVAAVFGYTERVAQIQSVAMLFFGGVGAYLLSYTLWRSRWAGLVTAICFTYTSAIFSNLEHMTITNCFALMPWLFWATTMAVRPKASWSFPALAFLIYFLITSGYPGVILMIIVWLFVYTIYLIYFNADRLGARLLLGARYLTAWLLGLGLAAVQWLPIVVHINEFNRGTPLTVDQALTGGNLSFKHIWGMFFQFMTSYPLAGNDPDISMRGMYFCALALPLVLAALLLIKERIVRALLLLSSVAFLMSCGSMFFGRVALHILFPFLNMTRYPAADSRALMVLGLVLLAGGGAKLLVDNQPQSWGIIFRACIGLIAIQMIGLFYFRSVYDPAIYNNVVVNFISAEILFVALAILALRIFSGRSLMLSLVAILALEAGTCVLANPAIVGERVTAEAYRTLRASHRPQFTPETADLPRIVGHPELIEEESRRAYTEKTFYLSDYNNIRLRRFDHLIAVGFTEWLTTGKRVVALPPDSRPDDYPSFEKQVRPVEYTISSYTPNQVVYKVRADQDSLLVFNEIAFPGWRAYVDGVQTPVNEVSSGLRCVLVTGGEHTIVMTFRPRSFYWGLAVSLVSVLLFLLWSSLIFYRTRRRPVESDTSTQPEAD
jgi:Bacterial membrane protein YfhO